MSTLNADLSVVFLLVRHHPWWHGFLVLWTARGGPFLDLRETHTTDISTWPGWWPSTGSLLSHVPGTFHRPCGGCWWWNLWVFQLTSLQTCTFWPWLCPRNTTYNTMKTSPKYHESSCRHHMCIPRLPADKTCKSWAWHGYLLDMAFVGLHLFFEPTLRKQWMKIEEYIDW